MGVGKRKEMRMKHDVEEMSSWNERITTCTLMMVYGFAFFMVMKGVFYILGLIHHGVSLLFGWPTKY